MGERLKRCGQHARLVPYFCAPQLDAFDRHHCEGEERKRHMSAAIAAARAG